MKRSVFWLLVLILCVLLGDCISFKIKVIPPAENYVEYIYLCGEVTEDLDLLSPMDIRSEFSAEDDSIICFLRLRDISQAIQLKWKWYAPDESMIRDSGYVSVNRDEKFLEIVTAYDELELNREDEKNIEGQWTVVVFMNDRLIGSRTFYIKQDM